MNFNVNKIREDFPALHQKVYGKDLVYFDNAATTQKPQSVIDAVTEYYTRQNCNIHRGVHYLSQVATEKFENTRKKVAGFINAASSNEIIFSKGTTDSVNLVRYAFGERYINEGDEIIISALEHHSNLVPWQQLCKNKKAVLKVIPSNEKGELLYEEFEKLLTDKTKLIAITHISNALGTIVDVKPYISKAHKFGARVLIDGAQAVMHQAIDVQELDCDFYCFSGHKMYAPMGAGVLYGKESLLEEMPPFEFGGEMVSEVGYQSTKYNELPFKFEAGTPNVEAVLGLTPAIDYIQKTGFKNIALYEKKLLDYATERLLKIGGISIYGTSLKKASVISFLIDNVHPYDAGTIIDKFGVAVRTGHHCAQPILDWFGIPGTIRASMVFYNTFEEIDRLVEAVIKAKEMLS